MSRLPGAGIRGRSAELGGLLLIACLLHFWHLDTIPPGLDEDSAANGWLAVQWLHGGWSSGWSGGAFPFWNGRNGATEPLMVLLQSLTTLAWGPSVGALRVVSALALALTAVVVYGLVWEIGRTLTPFVQRWGARLAGLALATSPAVLELGRTGLRATLLPLALGVFAWLLLVALRTQRYRMYVAAGLALGVVGYTYLAARAVPLAVGLFLLIQFAQHVGDPPARRRLLNGAAWLVGVAMILLLPQILFFLQYPFAFWSRAGAVTLAQNPLAEDAGYAGVLLQKLGHMLRLFGIAWWGQYNQGERPLLSPPIFVGFLAVWPLVWRTVKHTVNYTAGRNASDRGILLLALLLPVMLLPDLLGGDRLEPHSLRVIGIVVPAFALAGLGLAWLLEQLNRWWHLRRASAASKPGVMQVGLRMGLRLGLAGWLLVGSWGAGDWLLRVQPRLAQSEYGWYAREDVVLAQWLNAQTAPVLIPVYELSRTNLAYLTVARGAMPQGAWRAPAGESDAGPEGWQPPLAALLDDPTEEPTQDPTGRIWVVRMVEPVRPRVEASSYRYDEGAQALLLPESPGDGVGDLSPLSTWLMPPLAVEYLESAWHEHCAAPVELAVAQAGVMRPFAQACPLAATDLAGGFAAPTGLQPTDPQSHAGYIFDHGLHLAVAQTALVHPDWDPPSGAELPETAQMAVELWWRVVPDAGAAAQKRRFDLDGWRVFVHLVDDRFQRLAGEDFMPAYGLYSTEMWRPGAWIPLRQLVPRPATLPPGRYWLEVGLYDPLTGVHSTIRTPDGAGVERARFGPLKVPAPPPVEEFAGRPVTVHFGNAMQLDRFAVAMDGDGVRVRLRWTALDSPPADYTFFIHVMDGDGELVAQHDTQPRLYLDDEMGYDYPTGIWSPGEVVEMELTAPIPADMMNAPITSENYSEAYTVWVGAYVWDPATESGARLPVQLAAQDSSDTPDLENENLVIEEDRLRLAVLPVE